MKARYRHPRYVLAAAVTVALGSAQVLGAQQSTQPDNTKVNKQDRAAAAKTADQQSNDKADLELARQIRRSIVNDKTLSSYAHNVKIVAVGGKVTLKGPVRTTEEKAAVEAKAKEVAGPANVVNEISIAPSKKSTP